METTQQGSKTIAIMQPYVFPYIGYFQLINTVDQFIFYDDVHYINRGWINRNQILANKTNFLFTLPLIKASQNKRINEIEIAPRTEWVGKLLKTLETAYKKAPMFEIVFPLLQKWLNAAEGSIALFNYQTTREICDYLEIETALVPSSSVYQNTGLKAQERILDICFREKATRYINPIGGMEIYDQSLFESNGMELRFLKARPSPYLQFKNDFVPWLSIIDYLMFLPVETIKNKLSEFDLIEQDVY